MNKKRSDEFIISLTTVREYLDLEKRLEDSADKLDSVCGKVYLYNGLLSSVNTVRIVDAEAKNGIKAVVLNERVSIYGILMPIPKKLKAILREYHARGTNSSKLYFGKGDPYSKYARPIDID